jgi:hypothetical protein
MVEVVGLDPDHERRPVGRVNFRETRHVTDFVSTCRPPLGSGYFIPMNLIQGYFAPQPNLTLNESFQIVGKAQT